MNDFKKNPSSGGGARLVQLDFLRGVAVLLVLGHHFLPELNAGRLQPLTALVHRFGWTGVDLFFVLSGFLVGGLLFKELRTHGTLDVRRFWIRRAWKIWPPYLVFIGLLAVRLASIKSPAAAFHTCLPNFVHLQNYVQQLGDAPRGHTWSLAVEEHFYLLLPGVLWLMLRPRAPRLRAPLETATLQAIPAVPWLAGALIVGCTAMRCFTEAHVTIGSLPDIIWLQWRTHLRLDSLFFGVLLAYYEHFEPQRLQFAARHPGKLLLLGLALVSPMLLLPLEKSAFVPTFGFVFLYLGFGCIMLACVYAPPGSGLLGKWFQSAPARALAFVGTFSYSIYLWHRDLAMFPIDALAMQRHILSGLTPEMRWCAVFALYVAMAVIGGIFWAFVVEKPSLALRERLFPRRINALAPDIQNINSNAPRQEAPIQPESLSLRAVPSKPIPSGDNS